MSVVNYLNKTKLYRFYFTTHIQQIKINIIFYYINFNLV
jgi:hypothetical protein